MATVPEPCAMRTRVAMTNGTRSAGRLIEAIASARASPTPDSVSTIAEAAAGTGDEQDEAG
jgi:glycosyltransferase A (GT-A) superfamily protein (DUF2064 family)